MPDHKTNAKVHVAEMLADLLAAGRVVQLSQDEDGLFSGAASPRPGERARHSAATSLEGAVEGLTDRPRTRTCLRCGATKPLWVFGPDRDARDGHAASCKPCEAQRIGAIGRRKKAQAKEGGGPSDSSSSSPA